jgi:uncharacterized cupin superfamily protein
MERTKNVYNALETVQIDPDVGIGLGKLAGNDDFGIYCAELLPGVVVSPHYHEDGIETCQILEGEGVISTGRLDDNKKVVWTSTISLKKGDFITTYEREVHQLSNPSDKSLIVVFSAPTTHLGEDRIVIKEEK